MKHYSANNLHIQIKLFLSMPASPARAVQSISTLDGNCMLKVNEAFTKVLKNATHANDDNATFRWLYLAAKVKSTDEVCMRTAAQVRGYALK